MQTNPLEMTLQDAYSQFYERQKLRQASENARRLHRISLDKFDRFLKRPATLADLTDDTVADYLWWIHHDEQRSPRTANRCRDNILAQWRFYARKAIVPKWPDVEAIKEPDRIPVAWSKQELARLFTAIESLTGTVAGVPASLWWHSLHSVLWDVAERIGAAMQLDWRWVDLDAGFVTFKAETRKGKRRDRIHRVHASTVDLLKKLHEVQRKPAAGRVWPWKKHFTTLYGTYGRLLKHAGLPSDRMRKFHAIRRSAASWLEAAGGNATSFLDHSDRRTTTKSYLDPKIVEAVAPMSLLFRPDGTVEKPEPRPVEAVEPILIEPTNLGRNGGSNSASLLIDGKEHNRFSEAQMILWEMLNRTPTGVTYAEVRAALHAAGLSVDNLKQSVTRLRNRLRAIFSLPKNHNPIQSVPSPKGLGYPGAKLKLNLPTNPAAAG